MSSYFDLMENGWAVDKGNLKLDGDEDLDVKKDVLRVIENTSDIYYQKWSEKTLSAIKAVF